MKVVVAPDSFKGTYSAREVAAAIGRGLAGSGAHPVLVPVADGGEGTIEVISEPLGLRLSHQPSRNPWGRPCEGAVGLAPSGVAFVELAQVCGLWAPHPGPRDPVEADTYGVGMLMAAAADLGAERIVVAAGGSATSDGGIGALRAIEDHGGLRGAPVTVLTDVTTAYIEAAAVFGPQKGADPAAVDVLTERLRRTATTFKRDPSAVPGTGAAGGFAGALWAEHDADLVPGANYVLDTLHIDQHLSDADAVVVGEGRLDSQTEDGKIISALLARTAHLRRFAVVGSVGDDLGDMATEFDQVIIASDGTAMAEAGRAIASRLRSAAAKRGQLG